MLALESFIDQQQVFYMPNDDSVSAIDFADLAHFLVIFFILCWMQKYETMSQQHRV